VITSGDKISVHSGVTVTVSSSFAEAGDYAMGLTFDGTNLISCDHTLDKIYIYTGLTASISSSFAAPATYPVGLAFDEIPSDDEAVKTIFNRMYNTPFNQPFN